MLLILLNGILAGMSGCVFLLFPILLNYITKKNSTFQGILKFSLGLFFSQFFIFFMFNSIRNSLALFKIFQSLLIYILGLLLIFIFYFQEILKKQPFNVKIKHTEKNTFILGIIFGLSVTSCSFGFQIAALGFSSFMNLANTIIASALYSFGLILPLLIFSLALKYNYNVSEKYLKNQQLIERISNFSLLVMGYYFIFIGASGIKIKEVLLNQFPIVFFIWIYVLIYLFLSLKETKNKKISIYLVILILLFGFHCMFRKSCIYCSIKDLICITEILVFLITTLFALIEIKKNKAHGGI
ncbi:MAG: cytochrome c biogenesis protein CcdA [Candidatus Woesearchaeota archaeon]